MGCICLGFHGPGCSFLPMPLEVLTLSTSVASSALITAASIEKNMESDSDPLVHTKSICQANPHRLPVLVEMYTSPAAKSTTLMPSRSAFVLNPVALIRLRRSGGRRRETRSCLGYITALILQRLFADISRLRLRSATILSHAHATLTPIFTQIPTQCTGSSSFSPRRLENRAI